MSSTGPVRVHPENPHYLQYDGKPALLVTSAEHYGAMINRAFDYEAYLDALARYGLNYTRIYPGAYFEIEGMFIENNMLAPKPEDILLPWARSHTPGYALGGCKFDLDRWDSEYFYRLHGFLSHAERRGIVVEICLFNCQYPQCWHAMAINAANNVQGVGACGYNDVQTLRDPALVRVLERYVAKIAEEANPFDNVILEICDEPSLHGTSSAEATQWIGRMADAILEAERPLPKRHLIAQQLEIGVDFTEDDRVGLITTQYVRHNENRQIGGPEALDCLYIRKRPMELNETAFFPIWYGEEDRVDASRIEAWEFMVGGGAAFNQLNGFFTVDNPSGDVLENHVVLSQLQVLKGFLESFDIVNMKRDIKVLPDMPEGVTAQCISIPGRQYAIYLHHGVLMRNGLAYRAQPGEYEETLDLRLPDGPYHVMWVEPASGEAISAERLECEGGVVTLTTPEHEIDIALRIDAAIDG